MECVLKMRKDELSMEDIKQFVLFLKQYFIVPVCPLHEFEYLISIKDKITWKPKECCKLVKPINNFNVLLEGKGELGYIKAMNQAIFYTDDSSIKSKCAGTNKAEVIDRFLDWTHESDLEANSICQKIKFMVSLAN